MRTILISLMLAMFTSVVYGDAVIFSGNDVKALKYNLDLFGRSKLMGLNADPSGGAGVNAPLGTIGMDYLTGYAYLKSSAPDTGWTRILDSGFASLNYFKQGGNSFGATAVLGTNDANRLDFQTNGAVKMSILSSGSIGIGTTNPSAIFDVHSTTNPIIQSTLDGSQGANGGGTMQVVSDAGAAILSGSRLGAFQFTGAYDGLSSYANGAAINAVATENWSSTAQGTKINFNVTKNTTNTRTTAMTIDQDSSVTVTSSVFGALTVGPNGTTNPSFLVDSSAASAANGVKIIGNASGTSPQIITISSNTNEDIALSSKGAGTAKIQVGGSNRYSVNNQAHVFGVGTSSTASTVRFQYTGAADTSLTASAEAPSVYFNIGQTRSHSTGAIATQRDFRITPSTHAFGGASTVTTAAAFSVDGAPIAGSNATFTNGAAIYVPGQAVGAGTTNSYGVLVAANSGATNNYAAAFTGGFVGMGTSAPSAVLEIDSASGQTALKVVNSAANTLLNVDNNSGTVGIFSVLKSTATNDIKIAADGTNGLTSKYSNGYVGVNTASPAFRFVSTENATDPAASITAGRFSTTPNLTASNANGITGINVNVNATNAVAATATSVMGALIDGGQTANSGTVSNNYGMQVQYGSKTGSSGTITNAYGVQIIPYAQAGTVSNSYGVYILAPQSGGTLTNSFGIYQVDTASKNYLGGSLGLGIITPANKFHQDSGTATASYHQFTANATTGQTATDGTLIGIDASANTVINNQEATSINISTSGLQRMRFTALGSLVVGNNSSALATNATDGFLYISSSAGAPTGTPTAQTGSAPIHIDSTNNTLYYYSGSAWHGVSDTSTQGTRQTGTSMSAATAITPALNKKTIVWVVGNGGPVTITASPPITTTNMTVGQELKICGTSNANTVTYTNSASLVLNGSATLGKDQCLNLLYAGTDGTNSSWIEIGRGF